MAVKKSNQQFIKELSEVHNGKYTTNDVYITSNKKINFNCPDHGEFLMKPNNILKLGQGCPDCGKLKIALYNKSEYIDVKSKIENVHNKNIEFIGEYTYGYIDTKFKCIKHQEIFITNPSYVLQGNTKCTKCNEEKRAIGFKKLIKSHKQFVEDLKNHNQFIIAEEEYIDDSTPIRFMCLIHNNTFINSPNSVLYKRKSCPACSKESKRLKLSTDVNKFKNWLYNKNKNIKLINGYVLKTELANYYCTIHNENFVSKGNYAHLGCKQCKSENIKRATVESGLQNRKSEDQFKLDLYHTHHNRISLVSEYITGESISAFNCHIHGKFNSTPTRLLSGSGCPICRESKGEREIRKYLIENNYIFKSQYYFKNLRIKLPLRFDFAVFIRNNTYLIEFNGRQHYVPVGFGEKDNLEINKKYEYTKLCDSMKIKYCEENNISLLIIPYTKVKFINQILSEFISKD